MHARVATFEGGDTEQVRGTIGKIQQRASSGPPEGVPAVGFLVLHDPDAGKVMAVSLYETEDDMKQGDSALNAIDPPVPGGMGRRSSVEFYEVGLKIDN